MVEDVALALNVTSVYAVTDCSTNSGQAGVDSTSYQVEDLVAEDNARATVEGFDVVVNITFNGRSTSKLRNTEVLLQGVTLGSSEVTSCIIDDDVQLVVQGSTLTGVLGSTRASSETIPGDTCESNLLGVPVFSSLNLEYIGSIGDKVILLELTVINPQAEGCRETVGVTVVRRTTSGRLQVVGGVGRPAISNSQQAGIQHSTI